MDQLNSVLILGAPKSGKMTAAMYIAGKADLIGDDISHSGYIMKANLNTKYFNLEISLLIDEFPEDGQDIKELTTEQKLAGFNKWYTEFCEDEVQELREVIEGIILCIDLENDSLDYIEGVLDILDDVIDAIGDSWEGFVVVVGMKCVTKDKNHTDQIDDIVSLHGWEFINYIEDGKNEFNEKVGKQRLTEIFESHSWSNIDVKPKKKTAENYEKSKMDQAKDMTSGLLSQDWYGGEELDGFDDLQRSTPANGADFDLSEVFRKLQVAKGNMEGMSESEKKKYASDAVQDILNFI